MWWSPSAAPNFRRRVVEWTMSMFEYSSVRHSFHSIPWLGHGWIAKNPNKNPHPNLAVWDPGTDSASFSVSSNVPIFIWATSFKAYMKHQETNPKWCRIQKGILKATWKTLILQNLLWLHLPNIVLEWLTAMVTTAICSVHLRRPTKTKVLVLEGDTCLHPHQPFFVELTLHLQFVSRLGLGRQIYK